MDEQRFPSSSFFRAGHLTMKVILTISAVFFSSRVSAQEFLAAEPYGGTAGLKDLIRLEMIYPEEDMRKGTEGEVKLLIATDEKGAVSSIKVTRSVTPAMDSEAVRILRKVLWKPARYNGKAVADSQTVTPYPLASKNITELVPTGATRPSSTLMNRWMKAVRSAASKMSMNSPGCCSRINP